jgi:tetratricopeptide (TPR) repeat protein
MAILVVLSRGHSGSLAIQASTRSTVLSVRHHSPAVSSFTSTIAEAFPNSDHQNRAFEGPDDMEGILQSLVTQGEELANDGRYNEAETPFRQAMEMRERMLGEEHPDTLMSVSNLALVLHYQSKYEEAEIMNRRALNGRERVLGLLHPSTLRSATGLALTLQCLGKYEEAEAMNRRALSGKETVLGKEHPDTMASVHCLASVLADQGKYEEAEAMNRRSLDVREKILGTEHKDTLGSVSNLALVLQNQGKYEEAEAMSRRALDESAKWLGEEHPDTLTRVSNMASVLADQGKYEEAEAMNRRALDGRERVLGEEHPSTLTSVSNLALVLQRQGKYEEAEATDRRALDGREKVLGWKHPDTLTSVSNLALVLQRQGKYEEAEAMNQRALDGREKVLGKEHKDTLMHVYLLTNLLHGQKRYEAASDLYQRASSGYRMILGPSHPITIACDGDYRSMRQEMGALVKQKSLSGNASNLYTPLPSKTSIRLLHLQRGRDGSEIRCKLKIHELNAAPSYEALSYVWGNPEPPEPIYLNDTRVNVRPNLFAALRRLLPVYVTCSYGKADESDALHTRYKFLRRDDYWSRADSPTERAVWADAICINQEDTEEKSEQVKLMALIYSRASQVVIWLGSDEGDTVNALPIIATTLDDYKTSTKEDYPLPFRLFPYEAPPGYPNFGDEKWFSLARFFDKEWFERIWVIQEAALASFAVVFLGKFQLEWDAIGDAALWLYHNQFPDAAYRYLGKTGQWQQPELGRSIFRMTRAADIQLAKKFRITWDLMEAASKFKCTLPVDRIYGILGLVDDFQIEPDYSRPVSQVFRSMTRQLIEKRRDLMILGQVNHEPKSSPSCASSWVPQWPRDPHFTILNRPNAATPNMYYASAQEPLKLEQHQNESYLVLHGIPACKVVACSSTLEKGSGNPGDVLAMFRSIKDFIGTYLVSNKSDNLDTYSVILQVLTAGASKPPETESLDPESGAEVLVLQSMMEDGWALESMIENQPPSGNTSREVYPGFMYFNMGAEVARDIFPKVGHKCNGRRLFMTNDGHFGIGPRAMEPGDEVAVLFGGITPFIVRSVSQRRRESEGYGSYRFVGESYIHGFMKGEVITAWRNGLYNSVVFELQ